MTDVILSVPPSESNPKPIQLNKSKDLTLSQLYQAVTEAHAISDYKDIEPIHLVGFIAPDADAALNARILRNYGYSLTKPAKRKAAPRPSTSKRNFNAGNLLSPLSGSLGGAS